MGPEFPRLHKRTIPAMQQRAEISYAHTKRVVDSTVTCEEELEGLAHTILVLLNKQCSGKLHMSNPAHKIERRLFEDIEASSLTTNEALVMLGEMITSVAGRAVADERS